MRVLAIKVKPNARQEKLECQDDGSWRAEIKAPPVDGKANKALIALVARYFGLKKSQVSIKTGAGSRLKRVEIDD